MRTHRWASCGLTCTAYQLMCWQTTLEASARCVPAAAAASVAGEVKRPLQDHQQLQLARQHEEQRSIW